MASAAASSAPAVDAEATVAASTDSTLSGANSMAFIAALNENNTNQRTLNKTIQTAFSTPSSHPPAAPMDHGAFAAALAPALASAVTQASRNKNIDPGRPGVEPAVPGPTLKPLPLAAEVKELEAFDLNQFNPQVCRDNFHRLLHALDLRTTDHARCMVNHPTAAACSDQHQPTAWPSRPHLHR